MSPPADAAAGAEGAAVAGAPALARAAWNACSIAGVARSLSSVTRGSAFTASMNAFLPSATLLSPAMRVTAASFGADDASVVETNHARATRKAGNQTKRRCTGGLLIERLRGGD